jgi:outer membrane protein assembly factor BamE (lipoprotein component of BamABCDE complex)
MGWLARALAVVAAVFTAVACDPSGKVYEDVRLARLKEGESTEQDVRKLFGSPQSVREIAGGKGLVYPLGPEGSYTLLIRIGPDGKYLGRENLLTRANFGRVTTGMKQAEVLSVLGPPGRSQDYKLKNETAWEWRFNDGAETRLLVVMFNADGVVVSTAIEEDPRRMGGG